MSFNLDLAKRLVLDTNKLDWAASPKEGVWRKPLEREAKESGHASSVVKYEAGAAFSPHPHPLGEEIFVLDGVFSDESGDYPAGSYIRNPPGSTHAPFSKQGCTIFVKLNQFDSRDLASVHINTHTSRWLPGYGGLQVLPLHEFEHEHVALVKWPKGERFIPHSHFGGEEIFVLFGQFQDEYGKYPAGSWLRSPHLSKHFPFVEEETIIWVKTGHLFLQTNA